jgi:hypothetical protein
MAAKKKKARKNSFGAVGQVGKITFLYFSGDVGEFIDALTSTLKDPKVRSRIAEALTHMGPAISEVMRAEEAKAAADATSPRRRRAKGAE